MSSIFYLEHIEEHWLPLWLDSLEGWNSVFVTYEKPFVERLWRQHGTERVFLHRIHKCASTEAFWHVHPWASSMRILEGKYAMTVGVGESIEQEIAASLVLQPGSCYEMLRPKAAHKVYPLTDTTLSVMITGMPRKDFVKTPVVNSELPLESQQKLLDDVRAYYLGRKSA